MKVMSLQPVDVPAARRTSEQPLSGEEGFASVFDRRQSMADRMDAARRKDEPKKQAAAESAGPGTGKPEARSEIKPVESQDSPVDESSDPVVAAAAGAAQQSADEVSEEAGEASSEPLKQPAAPVATGEPDQSEPETAGRKIQKQAESPAKPAENPVLPAAENSDEIQDEPAKTTVVAKAVELPAEEQEAVERPLKAATPEPLQAKQPVPVAAAEADESGVPVPQELVSSEIEKPAEKKDSGGSDDANRRDGRPPGPGIAAAATQGAESGGERLDPGFASVQATVGAEAGGKPVSGPDGATGKIGGGENSASASSGTPGQADQTRVTDQAVRALKSVVNQRGGTLTLKLNPPELGVMRVRVELQANMVRAQFEVGSEQIRQTLQQQLHQLRSALEQQGLAVDRLQIHTAGFPGSSMDDGFAQAQEEGRSRGRFDQEASGEGWREAPDQRRNNETQTFRQELLDLVA